MSSAYTHLSRPIILLWLKLIHFIDSYQGTDKAARFVAFEIVLKAQLSSSIFLRGVEEKIVLPFCKALNTTLMDLKELPTLSARPPANHNSGIQTVHKSYSAFPYYSTSNTRVGVQMGPIVPFDSFGPI